jgi:protein SCO1/2
MKTPSLLVGVLLLAAAGAARAEDGLSAVRREVGFDQRLGEQVPLDLEFADESGKGVRLGDCLGGKPAVLVLAYYRCPMLCSQVLNGLVDGLRGVPFSAGREFNVVVVSFDAREKPELAAAKKAGYVEEYGRPGAEDGWHFLTGKQEAIDRLAAAVGFRFRYDPQTDQFAHDSGVTVLTPEGRVARYFFGLRYADRDLRLGLVEASAGRIGSAVDHVLLLCFHYDPRAGKYTAAVVNLLRLAGGLTVAVMAFLVGRSLLRERRQRGAVRTADPVGAVPTADPAAAPTQGDESCCAGRAVVRKADPAEAP